MNLSFRPARPSPPNPAIISRFCRQQSGNIAISFALLSLVCFGIVGLGIDMSRSHSAAVRSLAALDTAALAAARAMNEQALTDAEIRNVALTTFNANVQGRTTTGETHSGFQVAIDRTKNEVRVSVITKIPNTFTRLFNKPTTDVLRSATAVYNMKDIELAMMLDVSGSMRRQKIADLKAAARDVINILMPPNQPSTKVRIGLAPYSTSVNAGAFASLVTGGQSTRCVSERGGVTAFTDDAPFSPDQLTALPSSCPNATIMPLSNDSRQIIPKINAMQAGGMTAGHLGVAWAWYLVSPNWGSVWPASSTPVAYSDPKTMKVVILMTDGMFNTEYVSSNGTSRQQAISICNEMKRKNIEVYTVAFQAPNQAKQILQTCASSAKHFFDAQSGGELRLAFQSIANRLANLRISK